MIRLGLCCKFLYEPIRFRTTTATHLLRLRNRGENVLDYLDPIVAGNIDALGKAISYCAEKEIGCFRIGSDFLPVATHPEVTYTIEDLPSGKEFVDQLRDCGQFAKSKEIRLTFHPDQFVVLNSPNPDIVAKSLVDLEYHAALAELVGADVINIHGGGAYGDKEGALHRFAQNFSRLSPAVQSRLTVENDDKVYTPDELLPLCKDLGIPLVYDVHHHRCHPDSLSIEKATEAALATWNREPLFHISSPLEGWNGPKPHRHHDFINPKDVPTCWKTINPFTIEVEAKAKERAVLQLKSDLEREGWPCKRST